MRCSAYVKAAFIMCASIAVATSWSAPPTVTVFKFDGSRQCDTASGVALEKMQRELTENGIEVHSSFCANDGRMRATVCGADTGRINVYEINSDQLMKSLWLGFKDAGDMSPPLQKVDCKK